MIKIITTLCITAVLISFMFCWSNRYQFVECNSQIDTEDGTITITTMSYDSWLQVARVRDMRVTYIKDEVVVEPEDYIARLDQ